MKTLIVAINSKYIHLSLAPWYLKSYCGAAYGEIKVAEFTINDNPDSILSAIYLEKANNIVFSCYIWNIELILKLANNIKKVTSNSNIILGGPEVSFESKSIMLSNSAIDFIIAGEGEETFKELLSEILADNPKFESIDGLIYKKSGMLEENKPRELIPKLDNIPSPYTPKMLSNATGKILYFESSRGCPFSCSYCLSSTFTGIRYFSMERVKSDLIKIINSQVKQIKFVDRTFNCNKERAKEIIQFIIANAVNKNFHFEVAADLFNDELIEILSNAPAGLIQLEIGIQTTNSKALEATNRRTDISKVLANIEKLKNAGNMHLHVDLIAGLPYEDYNSFEISFNDVYKLRPHQIQLGFLKMLKGSGIRNSSDDFEYKFKDYPPYEILLNKFLNYDELLHLKNIEVVLERYYNSGKFSKSVDYLTRGFGCSIFKFYSQLASFYNKRALIHKNLSVKELYSLLIEFAEMFLSKDHLCILNELLKFDFLSSDNTNNLPSPIKRNIIPHFKERCFEFLKNTDNIYLFLPHFKNIAAKQICKKVHFESFTYDVTSNTSLNTEMVVLFDYSSKCKVTGLYDYKIITI